MNENLFLFREVGRMGARLPYGVPKMIYVYYITTDTDSWKPLNKGRVTLCPENLFIVDL